MITAIVHFSLPAPLTLEEAREVFRSTAPIDRAMPGLVRRVYLLSADGRTGGGVYRWETREAAERASGDECCRRVAQRDGAEPSVACYASPVIVGNLSGQILGG